MTTDLQWWHSYDSTLLMTLWWRYSHDCTSTFLWLWSRWMSQLPLWLQCMSQLPANSLLATPVLLLLLLLHYTFLLSYILALHWMLQAWIDAHTAMQMKCHPCIVQSWNQISWDLLFCHHDTFILPGRHFPLKRFYHTQSYTLNSNNSEKRLSQHCPRRRTWTTSASRNLHHFHLLNQDGDL